MKRIIALVTILLLFSTLAIAAERRAFLFYYGWYGNPYSDRVWQHWQEYDHVPPWDLASSFYPKLGAYSSKDLRVLDQHMRWIYATGVGTLIYSWWGKNDFTDEVVPALLNAAADYDLKIAFLIEPYPGRTPKSICSDIEYLVESYGRHPAFFRMADRTEYGPSTRRRPVFFIYDPDHPVPELRQMADTIHNTSYDSILLLQSTDLDLLEQTRVDGLFAYEAYLNLHDFYPALVKGAKKRRSIFVPCVSPGFNMNRTLRKKHAVFRPRRDGETYDLWWRDVLASDAQYVSIISFNEWHEGTQIEPAVKTDLPLFRYLSYDGAYGKPDVQAEKSYLQRTARWVKIFLGLGS